MLHLTAWKINARFNIFKNMWATQDMTSGEVNILPPTDAAEQSSMLICQVSRVSIVSQLFGGLISI